MNSLAHGYKLLDAIAEDKYDIAMTLLKGPVDFTVLKRGDGAIHMAARKGQLKLIKAMVAAGADPAFRNQNGNTACHYAAKGGNISILWYLKNSGVDVNTANDEGKSPIHMAVTHHSMSMIETLVDLGMDPNAINKKTGETPLHVAAAYGRLQAMEGLLLKGADPDIVDREDRRPEDVAKNDEVREAMASYASLLAALKTGYVQAIDVQITAAVVSKPYQLDRVGVIIQHIDIAPNNTANFYCRREKSENSSVVFKPVDDEYIFSDVFHFQLSDVIKECPIKLYLPLYEAPPDREELVVRFMKSSDNNDNMVNGVTTVDGVTYCLVEVTLIPDTSCVCVIFTRPRRENFTVPEDGTIIRSDVEPGFAMEIPPNALVAGTSVTLTVFESVEDLDDERKAITEEEDTEGEAEDGDTKTPDLLTDVYQINLSDGCQPQNPLRLQLPTISMEEGSGIAIVTANEAQLYDETLPSILSVEAIIVESKITFDVAHCSIYVAAPMDILATDDDLRSMKRRLSVARERRQNVTFLALCKHTKGRNHTLLVECGQAKRSSERLQKWLDRGYEKSDCFETDRTQLVPGDTFVVDVKGNASYESPKSSRKLKITISQCRSSFQAYNIQVDRKVKQLDEAFGNIIIKPHDSPGEEFQLRVKLHLENPKSVQKKPKEETVPRIPPSVGGVQFEVCEPENCVVGDIMKLVVRTGNATSERRALKLSVTLRSGLAEATQGTVLKTWPKEKTVEPHRVERLVLTASPSEYYRRTNADAHFTLTGTCFVLETKETCSCSTSFSLLVPSLTIQCDDSFPTSEERMATLSFTNKTSLTLTLCAFKLHVDFLAGEKIVKIESGSLGVQTVFPLSLPTVPLSSALKSQKMVWCTTCGQRLESSVMYCWQCGTRAPVSLEDCNDPRVRNYLAHLRKLENRSEVAPGEEVTTEIPLYARKNGQYLVTATFSAAELADVTAVKTVTVYKVVKMKDARK